MIEQISPVELQGELQQASLLLLDVREPDEYEFCHIEGSLHIPMSEIALRAEELPDKQTIVIVCHHGMRSLQVAMYLQQLDRFQRIVNLRGGVDAWATEVDPSMPRY